jgi:cytoskeletal protein CcmA (bactofilin family)
MTEAKQTDKRTLVEEGTELKGSLTSTCPVLVRGKVEGEVQAPALTVSPSGAVSGKARVGELQAEGQLSGEFDAEIVQLSGRVQDRTVIRAKTLSVQLASESKLQVVFGECELAVGDPPPDGEGKG